MSLFKTKDQIKKWLKQVTRAEFTIHDDLSVDVHGDVRINDGNLVNSRFPVQFREVHGEFSCFMCGSLVSLQGSPQVVHGHFSCGWCTSLTSFQGAPEHTHGIFYCNGCTSVTSLQGLSRNFNCTSFVCDDLDKKTHLLRLVKNSTAVTCNDKVLQNILTSYKGDVIGAQEALFEAGYEEQAQL